MTNATMDFILAGAIWLEGDKVSKRATVTKVACAKPIIVGKTSYAAPTCKCVIPCKSCKCVETLRKNI